MKFASLSQVCNFILDGTHGSPVKVEEGIPVLSAQNVNNGTLSYTSDRFTTQAEYEVFERRLRLGLGDVLLTIVGSIGRSALVTTVRPAVFQRSVAVLRPTPSILDSSYLNHAIQSRGSQQQLRSATNQSSQAGVYLGKLSKLQIPLPPIGEQRRIAAILDRAETLRAKRRHALAKLDSLVSETFFERFMSRIQDPAVNVLRTALSNPDGWKWAKLTDVARLATGHTPDRKRPDYWNGSISWISLTDIRELDGTIAQRTSESVSELGIAHSSSVKLPEGTVCFSRTASVGFVTIMGTEMATSQDFVNWVCGPDLDPIFLMHALLASRPTLLSLANGSTHRTIYLRTVEEFRCIVPPIKEQRQFREAVSSISKIRRHMANSLLLLNKNFASLQHRAFRGEL